MKPSITSAGFLRDRSGATIIEFAIVAPVFFLLLMGIIQFGLVTYNRAMVEAIVVRASRTAALGNASASCDRVCTMIAAVKSRGLGLINVANLTVTANTVSAGGTSQPDICLTEPEPSTPATCDPDLYKFEEHNGIPGYQGAANMSLGNAGDLVEVRVTYPYRLIIPLVGKYFGENGAILITSSTVIKNEPF